MRFKLIIVIILVLVGLISVRLFSKHPQSNVENISIPPSSFEPISIPITKDSIIESTNKEREKVNLSTLKENELLNRAAENLATDILREGKIPSKGSYYDLARYANNVGYPVNLVSTIVNKKGLFDIAPLFISNSMQDKSSKDIILDSRFKEIGIGFAKGDFEGKNDTVIVEIFANRY